LKAQFYEVLACHNEDAKGAKDSKQLIQATSDHNVKFKNVGPVYL